MSPGPETPPGPPDPPYVGITPDPDPAPAPPAAAAAAAEGRRGPSRVARTWITTAIACVVAVAAFFGIRAVTSGGSSSSSRAAASNRNGPPGGNGVAGTLQAVSGSTLTVATRNGGTTSVVTTPSTRFTKIDNGSVTDLKVGDRVVVTGTTPGADNTVAADRITDTGTADLGGGRFGPGRRNGGTGPNGTGPNGTGPNGTGPNGTGPNGARVAAGTVKSNDGSTLTVTEPNGTVVTVTTSPATKVAVAKPTTLQGLSVGQQVTVGGTTNSDGTVVATAVREGASGLGFGRGGGPGGPPVGNPGGTNIPGGPGASGGQTS